MPTFSLELLDRLRTFDTPTICNLIELFDVRPRTAGYGERWTGRSRGTPACSGVAPGRQPRRPLVWRERGSMIFGTPM